jgi:putative ABC transport system permease protein
LFIACGNVASLMMARGAARERELAVRSALGASRGRLVRQTLSEALLLSFASSILGWFLAELLLHLFLALAPAAIPFLDKARLDMRIAACTILLACFCGAAFGLLAALPRPRSIAVATRTSSSGSHARLRQSMVVLQISVSMVLLCASTLLVRSFWNLQRQNLGLSAHGVLTASIELGQQHYDTGQKQMEFFLEAETALRRLPGVTAVGLSDTLPPAGGHQESILNNMQVAGQTHSKSGTGGMVAWRWVTPEYFHAFAIPIVAGRDFSDEERFSSGHEIIVSQLLADLLFPGQNPAEQALGQRVQPSPGGPWYTITGVVANVRNSGLAGVNEPEYYRLSRNTPDDWRRSGVLILATSLPTQALAPWVRQEIARIDPTIPVEIQTMNERVGKLADGPRFEAALLSFFAFTGLAMAVIGLYGLTSYIAQRRTQEIGVRMALGAGRANILRLIAREGLRLILLGGVLGIAGAYGVTRVLKNLLFSVDPHDPATFAAVAVLLALVALVATLIPARAATRVDPMAALRCE